MIEQLNVPRINEDAFDPPSAKHRFLVADIVQQRAAVGGPDISVGENMTVRPMGALSWRRTQALNSVADASATDGEPPRDRFGPRLSIAILSDLRL